MGTQGKGTDRATIRRAEKLLAEGVSKAEVARRLLIGLTRVRKIAIALETGTGK